MSHAVHKSISVALLWNNTVSGEGEDSGRPERTSACPGSRLMSRKGKHITALLMSLRISCVIKNSICN